MVIFTRSIHVPLTTKGMNEAEQLLIHIAQSHLIQDKHFSMWNDDNLTCTSLMTRRYGDAELVYIMQKIPTSARHPVMLPRDHHLTRDRRVECSHKGTRYSGPEGYHNRNQVQILDSERTVPGEEDNKEMQYLSTYGRPMVMYRVPEFTCSTTRQPSIRDSSKSTF